MSSLSSHRSQLLETLEDSGKKYEKDLTALRESYDSARTELRKSKLLVRQWVGLYMTVCTQEEVSPDLELIKSLKGLVVIDQVRYPSDGKRPGTTLSIVTKLMDDGYPRTTGEIYSHLLSVGKTVQPRSLDTILRRADNFLPKEDGKWVMIRRDNEENSQSGSSD